MKKFYYIAMQITITTIVIISCKNGVVTPDDSNATPGRRDYTWVADTINNPFLVFQNIWGNDINNIWTAGIMMSNALYKYDGNKWSLDDRVYISDPKAIWGYENNVWIGNDKGSIWKFSSDINSYNQELTDFKVNGKLVDFYAMSGISDNEIFAVGYNYTNPVIVKYNSIRWILAELLPDSGGFTKIIYSPKNDKYYLLLDLSDYSSQIMEYNRISLKKIYQCPPSSTLPGLSAIDGYAYFTIEQKIYRYFRGNMEFIFEVNDQNFGGVVWGRNRNDILIKMHDGIAHYNGTDWKYLFKVAEPTWLEPHSAILEKDVFIPAKIQRTGYPIIYHGILK